jgi:predicted phage-related endonuclease
MKTIAATDYDRRRFIGGSDAAAILGVQPKGWRTAVELCIRKQDPTPPVDDAKAKRKVLARGTIVEPLVQQMLGTMYDVPKDRIKRVSNIRYIDPDCDYLAAEVDFEIQFGAVKHLFGFNEAEPYAPDDEPVNVEIKTVHPFASKEWGEELSDEVPIHYAFQVQHGLAVTGRRLAIAAALFGADDLVLYPIIRDDDVIKVMREKYVEFWAHVTNGTLPPPQTIHDTLLLWPDAKTPSVVADDGVTAALATMRQLTQARKSYADGEEGVSLLIREYMKDAKELVSDQGATLATLNTQKTTSIDSALLKESFPDVYKAVVRYGTTRVLRLKGE